jgi:hypothetical protein
MTMRMMPPASGLRPSILVNGRTYTCALGATIDVPDCDGFIMSANGWTEAANGAGSGTTAQRPSAVTAGKGTPFFDTTLGKVIRSDGMAWRDPNNGAAA